jgi:N-acetyl-anhydromuramyl-L-alanine amidase AmpD
LRLQSCEAPLPERPGRAFWDGATNINGTSVGIEIVHGGNVVFPDAQYDSILRLVREIRAAFPTITRQHVVGHMEIAVGSADRTLSSRRIDDPSEFFEWDRLEAVPLVRRRVAGVPSATIFGISAGQFVQQRGPSSRTLTPDITGIQTALKGIGYSIAPDGTTISGVFDDSLTAAIKAFQRRYFSGGNAASKGKPFILGRVDFETAFAIQSVSNDTLP